VSGEERLAMERACERAIELPPESWPVRAADEPPCARCGGLRTWQHRSWCEDCDLGYARAVQS
jgi:hypothetical protein